MPGIVYAQNSSIGRIVKKNGFVKKTNINCDSESCADDGIKIFPGDRIITGAKSRAEIVLDDGTAIVIVELSDLIIFSVLNKKNKILTNIFSDYGKFKIIQQNKFMDASFVFKTRTAIIKSVCATMNVAAGGSETSLFVYKGEAGFANIDPSIIEAYIVKEGQESFLKKESPPVPPEEVDIILRSSWLNRHFLTKDKDGIIKYNKKSGPADWFFIDKK